MEKFWGFLEKNYLWIILVCGAIIFVMFTVQKDVVETNVQVIQDKMSNLTEEEKIALEFLSAAKVHNDPSRIYPIAHPNLLEGGVEGYRLVKYYNPGKVKVATRKGPSGVIYIDIFIPKELRLYLGETRETVTLLEKDGRWLVAGVEAEARQNEKEYGDFEGFQESKFWKREGQSLEWKDAELK